MVHRTYNYRKREAGHSKSVSITAARHIHPFLLRERLKNQLRSITKNVSETITFCAATGHAGKICSNWAFGMHTTRLRVHVELYVSPLDRCIKGSEKENGVNDSGLVSVYTSCVRGGGVWRCI